MLMSPVKPGEQSRVSPQNIRAFQQVLQEVFGIRFTLFDAHTGTKISGVESDAPMAAECHLDISTVLEIVSSGQATVLPAESNCFRILLVLHVNGTACVVAAGVMPALSPTAAGRGVEQRRLQYWARDFSERLRLRDQLSVRTAMEEGLREQLNSAWKVNLTLGECMQRLRFSRHEIRDRQRILQAAHKLLNVQALLWVPSVPGHQPLVAGETTLNAEDMRRLARDVSQNTAVWPEPIFCNDPQHTSWGGNFPRVENLLAFHVQENSSLGCIIALNKRELQSHGSSRTFTNTFRRSDAAILSPFVSMIVMQTRAAGKFDELRSLLVGLARALTAAIDAKDAYTAGHSERVARLAVEIGRELELPDEQLSDTYLAGLLHDVGKIGIREDVLCKPGRLLPQEFDHMKQHVTIGFHILQDLHPIRHLMPGVLYHHERFDGRGYPEGLAGEKIPFLARLLAVADGFDAMNSNRPYRPALTQEQLLKELERGAGTQWDPQIVAAALRCVHRLTAIGQRGLGESLRQAVDAVLRTGDSSMLTSVKS